MSPLQLSCPVCRSGSHSPFPIHVDVLGPVSTSPGGQLNVTLVPSTKISDFLSLLSAMNFSATAPVNGLAHFTATYSS